MSSRAVVEEFSGVYYENGKSPYVLCVFVVEKRVREKGARAVVESAVDLSR